MKNHAIHGCHTVEFATNNFNLILIIKNQPVAIIQIDNECGK